VKEKGKLRKLQILPRSTFCLKEQLDQSNLLVILERKKNLCVCGVAGMSHQLDQFDHEPGHASGTQMQLPFPILARRSAPPKRCDTPRLLLAIATASGVTSQTKPSDSSRLACQKKLIDRG